MILPIGEWVLFRRRDLFRHIEQNNMSGASCYSVFFDVDHFFLCNKTFGIIRTHKYSPIA